MPIITEARLLAAGRPLPQELLDMSASIIRRLAAAKLMDGQNYSEKHYNAFVNEILVHLQTTHGSLEQLIKQYEKHT